MSDVRGNCTALSADERVNLNGEENLIGDIYDSDQLKVEGCVNTVDPLTERLIL